MKALQKIGVILLTLVMVLSTFTFSVSAEHAHNEEANPLTAVTDAKCGEGDLMNVALGAHVIGDKGHGTTLGDVFWSVSDHYANVVDGDPQTLCVVDTTHWENYGLWITLDDSYFLDNVEIQTYGVGRVQTSQNAYNLVANRSGQVNLTVEFYDANGTRLYTEQAIGGKENIVIDLSMEDIDRVKQIYVYFPMDNTAQGIWEVAAYSNDIHAWQDVDGGSIKAPSCSSFGQKLVECPDCKEQKIATIDKTPHKDTCKGKCDSCGQKIEILHQGNDGCLSTECVKCGEAMTGTSHTKNTADPCDSSCVKCGMEDVFDADHVYDISNPCNNDCVKCGAKDVIPSAYDFGPEITKTNMVAPYSYAPHVANPNDPCDTTCYECKREKAVKAAHVPDPENPCTVSECFKCQEDGVFAHYAQSSKTVIYEPHVRPDRAVGSITVNGASTYSCRLYCAKKGCSGYKLSYAHEFDNCADSSCNLCGSNISADERAHRFTAESPIKCVDCGYIRAGYEELCEVHTYTNDCDPTCNSPSCGYNRYSRRDVPGGVSTPWHIYDNTCDTTCNDCGEVRAIEHTYMAYVCATECTVCGYVRDNATPHTYSNFKDIDKNEIENSYVCDPDCDVCGEEREITHNFEYVCAPNCSICGTDNEGADELHKWDNSCDTTCNNEGCTLTREKKHDFTSDCDPDCNNEGCDGTQEIKHAFSYICDATCDNLGCEYTREVTHSFKSDCDPDCNTQMCEYTRDVAPHVYDNNCDKFCNVANCGFERNATQGDPNYDENYIVGHIYDSVCDASCNSCGATRAVPEHEWDNPCDTECNVENCGYTRTVPHSFGAWQETKPAEKNVEGEQARTCQICGATETQKTPAKTGLSTGATVAIVVGSVAVVGGGGFCLWWFVFKKKFFKS